MLRRGILAVPSHLDLKLLADLTKELGLTELSKEIKEKDAPSLGDWIKLDVGGTIFKTTRATLTQVPDSRLAEMVNATKAEDVLCLDLDLNPEYFRPILDWLR